MLKRVLAIAMAFVGLSVGAGFASGQEVMQFFVHFGVAGIWGSVFVAVVMCVVGMIILQLGSYYQANEHTAVLDEVAHPLTAKLLDWAVMLTIFSIGFVMFAGAGANLYQQFGWSKWIGSVILLALVLVIGRLDVDKVSNAIAATTPFIIVFLIIAFFWCVFNAHTPVDVLEAEAATIKTTLPNVWIGALNYVGFSLIVVVSMSIVIGGYYLNPRIAGLGGLMGGLTFGLMLVMSTVALFLQVPGLQKDDLPMLTIVGRMHPIMGMLMSLAIYGMIFNSALGMFYALARRLTANAGKKAKKKFYPTFVVAVLAGFVISFLGFRTLVTYVYPLLGYVGVALSVILVIAWAKDLKTIRRETRRRMKIKKLMTLKLHPRKTFTPAHEKRLAQHVAASNIEDEELVSTVEDKVAQEIEENDNIVVETTADSNQLK